MIFRLRDWAKCSKGATLSAASSWLTIATACAIDLHVVYILPSSRRQLGNLFANELDDFVRGYSRKAGHRVKTPDAPAFWCGQTDILLHPACDAHVQSLWLKFETSPEIQG